MDGLVAAQIEACYRSAPMSRVATNTPNRPDAELLEASREGDFGAFEEIVGRYRDRIYRLALSMTRNASEAEEVVQDSFLRVFRGLATFRGDSSFSSWLYRVATNAALVRLRRRRRKPLLSIEDTLPDAVEGGSEALLPLGDWSRQPEEKLLSRELGERINAAIEAMPEKYRVTLLLRDVEGLSSEEVAQTLGVTVPTVRTRLHRARLIVRSRLNTYFQQR